VGVQFADPGVECHAQQFAVAAGLGPLTSASDSGGGRTDWTTRNTLSGAWTPLDLARMVKDTGASPPFGTSTQRHLTRLGHPPRVPRG
jgi:hypothetical protein